MALKESEHKEITTKVKSTHRKLSVKQLKNFGYKLSDNQIPLGNKPYKFGILEVRNDGIHGNKEVSFCLLYSVDDKMGIILPNKYNYYIGRPEAAYELLR